jgi:hypothetical protein
MSPKKIDELVLGARYLVVPKTGLVVRKAPRVSLAAAGEALALDMHLFRAAQAGDVSVFEVPVDPAPQAEAPAPVEAPTESTPELEQSAAKPTTRSRGRGDS